MLRLAVPLVVAQAPAAIESLNYSGISRISRLSFLLGHCVSADWLAR